MDINEIIDFIHRRFPIDCNWTNGNCCWFAAILVARFHFLSIYYLPISGHFLAGALGKFFDWTGCVIPDEIPILFDDIEKEDPSWAKRIIRDCVL